MNKNKLMRSALLSASIASIVSAPFAAPAFGQGAEDDDIQLEEIIVTTERRGQSLQDVAAVAKVVTGDDLRRQGINKFTDLATALPQLNIGNREGNVEVFIRGVGDDNNTELSEPRSAILYDGVYLSRPRGLGAFFFDLETVEVNIGPQGTLRGRNATGGSLNLKTAKPTLGEFGGYVDLSVGNFDLTETQFAVNAPINENAAFRVAGYSKERDATITGIGPIAPLRVGRGATEDRAARLSFRWEPTDRLSIDLAYDYLEGEGTGNGGLDTSILFNNLAGAEIAANGGSLAAIADENGIADLDFFDISLRDLEDPLRLLTVGPQEFEDTEIQGFKGNLVYDFGYASFEYILGYRDVDFVTEQSFADLDFGDLNDILPGQFAPGSTSTVLQAQAGGLPPFPAAATNFDPTQPVGPGNFPGQVNNETVFFSQSGRLLFDQDFSSISHEVRFFANDDNRIRWTAGAFYFRETGASFFNTISDLNFFAAGVEFAFPDLERENFAFYADSTFDISDTVRITGGIRFTEESIERTGFGGQHFFQAAPGRDGNGSFRLSTEGFQFAGRNRDFSNFPTEESIANASPQDLANIFGQTIASFGIEDTFAFDENGNVVAVDAGGIAGDPGGTPLNAVSVLTFNDAERTDNFIDWRARVEWDITDANLLYGSVSTGTNSGGFNDAFEDADTGELVAPEFEVESVTVFEIGSKNEYSIGGYGGSINVAAFFYDYQDQQFTTLAPVPFTDTQLEQIVIGGAVNPTLTSLRQNLGESQIIGADIDWTQNIPGGLKARLNIQLLDTEIIEADPIADSRFDNIETSGAATNFATFVLPTVFADLEGNELPKASEISGLFSLSQSIQSSVGKFDWILSVGFRSDFFLTVFNGDGELPTNAVIDDDALFAPTVAGFIAATENNGGTTTAAQALADSRALFDQSVLGNAGSSIDRVDGFFRFDLGFGYEPAGYDNIRFEVFGKNLTDIIASQSNLNSPGLNLRFTNDPRIFGARVRVEF